MEIERWDNGEVIFSGESIQEGIAKGIVFYHADLSGADLSGANLDMAGIPLSCGGLRWKIDRRIFVQFVYHLCSHQIENDDCKAVQKSLIKLANEMHRTDVPRLEE